MGRKGRPRSALAERFPAGHVKPPAEKSIPPALWGRLKRLNDPLLSSQVGWLVFEGHLSRVQAEVAFRIRETYERWHRSQRQRTSAKSANLEQGFSASSDVAEERLSPDQIELLETETERIEANFRAVDAEIQACPAALRTAVLDLCVYDVAISPGMYHDLRKFLTRLGHFFTRGRPKRGKKDVAQQLGGFALQKEPESHAPAAITHIRQGDPVHLGAKIACEKVVRKLIPKITDGELARIVDIFVALKDRETMRLRKTARSP